MSTIAYNFSVKQNQTTGMKLKRRETSVGTEMPVEEVESFTWEEFSIEGFLLKQDPSGFLKFWRKKWFSLQGSRLLYYDTIDSHKDELPPESYISLSYAKSVEEDKSRTNAFMIGNVKLATDCSHRCSSVSSAS